MFEKAQEGAQVRAVAGEQALGRDGDTSLPGEHDCFRAVALHQRYKPIQTFCVTSRTPELKKRFVKTPEFVEIRNLLLREKPARHLRIRKGAVPTKRNLFIVGEIVEISELSKKRRVYRRHFLLILKKLIEAIRVPGIVGYCHREGFRCQG